MSKGFLIVAQNTDACDYITQAYALALSILSIQKNKKVSLVTNDVVPDHYLHAFDKVIPIPFTDSAAASQWKVENRWKVYYASPYTETIVLDADMIVLSNLQNCWKFVKNRELFFTNSVKNYKGNTVVDTTYRKTFISNDLPNVYTGFFYFKKCDFCLTFFKLLEYITYNWERFFFEVAPKDLQPFYSLDVAAAIAVKILGIEHLVTHSASPFTFVHMKPALQGWPGQPDGCFSQILVSFNKNKRLTIGNYTQTGIFHYVDPVFLTDDIIGVLNG